MARHPLPDAKPNPRKERVITMNRPVVNSVICFVLCLILLAGCGGSKGGGPVRPPVPPPPPAPEPEPEPPPDPISHEWWSVDPSVAREVIGGGVLALTSEQIKSNILEIHGSSDTLLMSDEHVYIVEEDAVVRVTTSCKGSGCSTDLGGETVVTRLSDFVIPASGVHPVMRHRGIGLAQEGDRDEDGEDVFDSFSYGGWLQHNYFFVLTSAAGVAEADTYETVTHDSIVIGNATGRNPTSGSGRWNGVMVGIDISNTRDNGNRIQGDAEVRIDDFLNPDVDVSFTNVFDLYTRAERPSMTWQNLPLAGGSFKTGSGGNQINGKFYGPNHEEVGGIFERNQIVGAFGARR